MTQVMLLESPTEIDWREVRRRAFITIYQKEAFIKSQDLATGLEWRHKILEARHSPIRYLRYAFLFKDIPSNIAVHLCRHVHAQPYVSSLRNDRQDAIDGDKARRDTPVNMILDLDAEELMVIANKRLCAKASEKTQEVVRMMCGLAEKATPELAGLLVPMCEYHGGKCHEMKPCGRKDG